jgi:hypothetical protein
LALLVAPAAAFAAEADRAGQVAALKQQLLAVARQPSLEIESALRVFGSSRRAEKGKPVRLDDAALSPTPLIAEGEVRDLPDLKYIEIRPAASLQLSFEDLAEILMDLPVTVNRRSGHAGLDSVADVVFAFEYIFRVKAGELVLTTGTGASPNDPALTGSMTGRAYAVAEGRAPAAVETITFFRRARPGPSDVQTLRDLRQRHSSGVPPSPERRARDVAELRRQIHAVCDLASLRIGAAVAILRTSLGPDVRHSIDPVFRALRPTAVISGGRARDLPDGEYLEIYPAQTLRITVEDLAPAFLNLPFRIEPGANRANPDPIGNSYAVRYVFLTRAGELTVEAFTGVKDEGNVRPAKVMSRAMAVAAGKTRVPTTIKTLRLTRDRLWDWSHPVALRDFRKSHEGDPTRND